MRVGLLANPRAGNGLAATVRNDVKGALAPLGAEVINLSGPTGRHALLNALGAVRDGIDALLVIGGDGIAHVGVNAVAGTDTPLGLIAVGTGNDAARALGLPVQNHIASLNLMRSALDPRDDRATTRRIDAGMATAAGHTHTPGDEPISAQMPGPDLWLPDGSYGHPRWFISSAAIGFDSAVNRRANTYRYPHGSARYVRAVLRETVSYRPYGTKITLNGHSIEGPKTLVCVANTHLYGGGLAVAPDAVPDDGLFDVVVIEPVSRATLLQLFPKFRDGQHASLPQVTIHRAADVLIEPSPDHGRIAPSSADGEDLSELPVRLRAVPGALSILAPTLEV